MTNDTIMSDCHFVFLTKQKKKKQVSDCDIQNKDEGKNQPGLKEIKMFSNSFNTFFSFV